MRMKWHGPWMEKGQVQLSTGIHHKDHATSENINPKNVHFVYSSYKTDVNLPEKRYAKMSDIGNYVERNWIGKQAVQ